MSPFRPCLAALLLGSMAFSAEPAHLPLPPVSGELSGRFKPLRLQGVPELSWTLHLGAGAAAGARRAELTVSGPGTQVHAELAFSTPDAFTWRLLDAELDLAAWFDVLAPRYFPSIASLQATGIVRVSGEGTWRGGAPAGRMRFELRDGTLHDAALTWSISGLVVRGTVRGAGPDLESDGPLQLSFRDATVAGIVARDGAMAFSLDAQRIVHVASATCALLDGEVAFSPFAVSLRRPEVKTQVHFAGVELSGLARFLPSLLAEARGPVSGDVAMSWTAADGLVLAEGALRPRPTENASIKLAPSPGFLTSHLPASLRERIDLLPKWLGPIRKLFMPKNPAYDTLRAIEMGTMPLEVKTLEVDVQPGGDARGRSAHIVVSARPAANESAVDAVRFEINVTGPLAEFVRLALAGRLSVHLK